MFGCIIWFATRHHKVACSECWIQEIDRSARVWLAAYNKVYETNTRVIFGWHNISIACMPPLTTSSTMVVRVCPRRATSITRIRLRQAISSRSHHHQPCCWLWLLGCTTVGHAIIWLFTWIITGYAWHMIKIRRRQRLQAYPPTHSPKSTYQVQTNQHV